MKKITMKSILIIILALMPMICIAESKLDNIKKETKKEKPNKKKPSKHHHHSNNNRHSHHDTAHNFDGDDGLFFLELTYYFLFSIYAVPHHYIDAGFDIMISFPSYPYHPKNASQGYLDISEPDLDNFCSLHTSIEAKIYKDDITGYGTHVNFYNSFRFDILTDYTYLTENINEDETSELAIGSANLTFRFAQNEYIQMRSGIGVNFLFDEETSSGGFNFLYAIDLYPAKPLFLSLRFDGGQIGTAGYTRLRGLIGFLYKRFEVNTGFELISIGSENLTGVILGTKFSF